MIPIVDAALKLLDTGVKRIWPDPTEVEKAKLVELQSVLGSVSAEMAARMNIIVAEASGKGLKASWRPLLMLLFGAIIANNYIVAPYMGALFGVRIMLEIPPDMWGLLKLGVGGYIGGRSLEKVAPALMGALRRMKK